MTMIHRAIPTAVALTAVLSISCASPPPIAGEIRESRSTAMKAAQIAAADGRRSDRVRPGWTRCADGDAWLSRNVRSFTGRRSGCAAAATPPGLKEAIGAAMPSSPDDSASVSGPCDAWCAASLGRATNDCRCLAGCVNTRSSRKRRRSTPVACRCSGTSSGMRGGCRGDTRSTVCRSVCIAPAARFYRPASKGALKCLAVWTSGACAAVEFALLLPVLIMVLFGIIEFGVALSRQQVLDTASREGGASRHPSGRTEADRRGHSSACAQGVHPGRGDRRYAHDRGRRRGRSRAGPISS
jgi:hypothetical protein